MRRFAGRQRDRTSTVERGDHRSIMRSVTCGAEVPSLEIDPDRLDRRWPPTRPPAFRSPMPAAGDGQNRMDGHSAGAAIAVRPACSPSGAPIASRTLPSPPAGASRLDHCGRQGGEIDIRFGIDHDDGPDYMRDRRRSAFGARANDFEPDRSAESSWQAEQLDDRDASGPTPSGVSVSSTSST